tara:strand:- start:3752 stop:4489 length:738 start_codon:yes stop_codon:yes gene_type:complete
MQTNNAHDEAIIGGASAPIIHIRKSLATGNDWATTLLEAIGLWTLPEEIIDGRKYKYLIHGEALDWLLLAERLLIEMNGYLTDNEYEELVFEGVMPSYVDRDIFRRLIGPNKYRAYLNYWYGVVIEEALQLAVEEEVRKRHRALCYPDSEDFVEDAFGFLYNKNMQALLIEFAESNGLNQSESESVRFSLSDQKEFTYSLFKLRMHIWDPARIASDMRKGILKLEQIDKQRSALVDWEYIDSYSV